jgi:hypothetical protein
MNERDSVDAQPYISAEKFVTLNRKDKKVRWGRNFFPAKND